MRFRPVSLPALVDEIAEQLVAQPPRRWLRVAVDGAPPAGTAQFADQLADALRLRGRPALRVSAQDFLRPASVRLERGRHNPDARYEDWLDVGGLTREVLGPLGPGGSGRALPSLWDVRSDRATRAGYQTLPGGGVVLVDGELLLGRGLAFDYRVHLWLSLPALVRQISDEERWAVPAFERYESEVHPLETADIAVRVDNRGHPALFEG